MNNSALESLGLTPEQIKKLLKIAWWDWKHETILKRLEDFKNVTSFIKKYE